MKYCTAPFDGNLIEMPDRADRITFVCTVIELTREGEFPPTTRVYPHGDCLIVNLSCEQIEDVRAAIAATRAQERLPEPPEKAPRGRGVPIPDETKALIVFLLEGGMSPSKVARAVNRPYSSVYYFIEKARRANRA